MKTNIYDGLEDNVGKEATDELLEQEPAIKQICDYASNQITGEIETDADRQVFMKLNEMGHWRLMSISATEKGRVYFTAQCLT